MILDFGEALRCKKSLTSAPPKISNRTILCLRLGRSELVISYGKQVLMTNHEYRPAKAAQMIAYFAMRAGKGAIDIMKAIKLVYLADRESIRRFGEPILDEPRYSLPHGPVGDETYGYLKGDKQDAGWSRLIGKRDGNEVPVKATTLSSLDELSEDDLECLDATWKSFGFMETFALSGWTHKDGNIPEWEDPNGSSRPISLESMMKGVGIDAPEELAEHFEERRSLASILREARK